jgi:hypothetical protein
VREARDCSLDVGRQSFGGGEQLDPTLGGKRFPESFEKIATGHPAMLESGKVSVVGAGNRCKFAKGEALAGAQMPKRFPECFSSCHTLTLAETGMDSE